MKKVLALAALLSAALLVILHNLAEEFFWYWSYRWIDVPMHFLGGFAVGSLALYAGSIFFKKNMWGSRKTLLVVTFVPLLLIGVLWEVFELLIGVETIRYDYLGDTLLDLLMDVVGGYAVLLLMQNIHTKMFKGVGSIQDGDMVTVHEES